MAYWMLGVLFMSVFHVSVKADDKQKLVKDLLKDYNHNIDPGNIQVDFGLSYICAELDDDTGKLRSSVWEQFTWTDNRLSWDPAKYSNIERLRIPARLLWQPDIVLYNSPSHNMERADVNAILYANGTILWIPPTDYVSFCHKSRQKEWHCSLKIGSWTFDGRSLKLVKYSDGFDLSMYMQGCHWKVSGVDRVEVEEKYYPCCPDEPYPSFEAEFRLVKSKSCYSEDVKEGTCSP